MKCLLISILLLLTFNSCAYASNWTTTDTKYQVAYSILDAMDWAQTRYISEHSMRYSELNLLLGRHPSIGKVNIYFMGVELLGNFAVSYVLPQPYRRIWQVMSIGVEIGFVGHNMNMGIKFKF